MMYSCCLVLLDAQFGSERNVRYLKIIEKSGYQALPCVRYITMAGDSGKEYMHNRDVFCLFFQGVYNPHMGQHYLQIYGVPSTVNTNIVPYGQMGHPLSGNHGYPTIQGYVTPGRHALQYGGPLVNGVTTDTITITQAQYLAASNQPYNFWLIPSYMMFSSWQKLLLN
ncbi:hypothetical protein CsSME_00009132 [Camellia sinensis var. sinensis]